MLFCVYFLFVVVVAVVEGCVGREGEVRLGILRLNLVAEIQIVGKRKEMRYHRDKTER